MKLKTIITILFALVAMTGQAKTYKTIKPSRRRASGYSRRSWLQTMYQSLALAAQHDRTSIYQHYIHQYEHHTQQR